MAYLVKKGTITGEGQMTVYRNGSYVGYISTNSSSSCEADANDTITLVSVGTDGYVFDNNFTTSPSVTWTTNSSFIMPSQDVSISCSFSQGVTYHVTSNVSGLSYTIRAEHRGLGALKAGDVVTLSVNAPEGYVYSNFTITPPSSQATILNRHQFIVPNYDGFYINLNLIEKPETQTFSYYDGIEFIPCTVNYYDGTEFIECEPFYYDGTEWIPISGS